MKDRPQKSITEVAPESSSYRWPLASSIMASMVLPVIFLGLLELVQGLLPKLAFVVFSTRHSTAQPHFLTRGPCGKAGEG